MCTSLTVVKKTDWDLQGQHRALTFFALEVIFYNDYTATFWHALLKNMGMHQSIHLSLMCSDIADIKSSLVREVVGWAWWEVSFTGVATQTDKVLFKMNRHWVIVSEPSRQTNACPVHWYSLFRTVACITDSAFCKVSMPTYKKG